jgi:hypothetical protein
MVAFKYGCSCCEFHSGPTTKIAYRKPGRCWASAGSDQEAWSGVGATILPRLDFTPHFPAI